MADLERITIVMPAPLAAEIKAAVDSGDYTTSSEVVRDALRAWRDRREFAAQKKAAQNERMREAWDRGMASLEAHGAEPWDIEKTLAKARKRLSAEQQTLHDNTATFTDA